MQSQIKSRNEIDIKEFYALNIKSLWKGLKQEHISFWFLCSYLFFEYVRPQSLYPVIDIIPWAQVLLILTIATMFTNKSISWVSNPLNILFVLFLIVITVSGIYAYNPTASWAYKEAMLGWLIIYFLIINIVNTEKLVVLFFLAYLLFNLKMAQHGAVGWASRGFSFASYGLIGSPGWFHNSGEYAIQMLIYGSLAIAFVASLREYWGRYKRWILYVAAATGYMSVVGSSSRGAQIALAIIGVLAVLKMRNGYKGLIALGVVSAALYYLLPEEQILRFTEMGDDRTSLQRLAYWEVGYDIIEQHPVIGIGYNNWISYLNDFYPDGIGPLKKVEVSHNIFIQATAELGYTGLIVFLIMVLYAFLNNLRTRKIAKEIDNKLFYNLAYGLDAGLIGFLIAGFFVTVLYYPFFWIQISMIVALNGAIKNKAISKKPTRDKF